MALLSQIVDKLESLEQEKEELTQYQKFDKGMVEITKQKFWNFNS